MKKIIASTLVAAAALVGFAGGASAHTPKVEATCGQASPQLIVTLTQYEKRSTVTINGTVYPFNGGIVKQVSLGDPKVSHAWTVTVDNRGDGVRDEWDRTFTGTIEACEKPVPTTIPILEDKDLTPPPVFTVPPKIEYIHPATPPCVLDGRYDAHSPECDALNVPVVLNPPAVLDRQPQPPVLAFTGSEATDRAGLAVGLFGVGLSLLYVGRRFGKVA